jgi:lipocalin
MKLFAVLLQLSLAQHLRWFTKCPVPTEMDSFDVRAYTGRWYDVSRISVSYQEDDAQCPTVLYTYQDETSVIVNNTQLVQNGDGTQTSEYIIGSAVIVDDEKPNQLFVSFEFDNAFLRWFVNLFTRLLGPNYWVQDVDYDKYSLVVSCENWWILTRTSAWILARDQHLPKNDPELMSELYDKLEGMNVPVDVMFESKHDNCEYDGQQYYSENANDVFSQINKK